MNTFTNKFVSQFIRCRFARGAAESFRSTTTSRWRAGDEHGSGNHARGPQFQFENTNLWALHDQRHGTLGPPVWPAFSYSHNLRGQHALADVSHVISPTAIFDFRAGYSRFHQVEVTESAFKQNTAKLLGLNGTCDLPACCMRRISPSPISARWAIRAVQHRVKACRALAPGRTRFSRSTQAFISLAAITRYASDSLATGIAIRLSRRIIRRSAQFQRAVDRGPGSAGFAYADLVLGLPREIQAGLDIFDPNLRNSHVMPWAQDDWKVSRRLTINFGIRYEWMGKPQSNRDKIANFYQTSPTSAEIITPQDTGLAGYFKKPDSLGRSLLGNDNNNFAPRVGFALQLDPKSVVRGAYGVFYQRDAACTWVGMALNPPLCATAT